MMIYKNLHIIDFKKLNQIPQNHFDVIIFNTFFIPDEIHSYAQLSDKEISKFLQKKKKYLDKIFKILKNGGLLFVYGLPKWLPYIGKYLESLKNEKSKMIFKYWIAVSVDEKKECETLLKEHIGILFYLKSKNGKTSSPFHLNTKTIRVPYRKCKICGENIKDWGGKKHLLNPLGACLSDVWRDFPNISITDCVIPDVILKRIYDLTERDKFVIGYIKETTEDLYSKNLKNLTTTSSAHIQNFKKPKISDNLELNKVIHIDSLKYMKYISNLYPEGIFDLAFADPPYNLSKNYSSYNDVKENLSYINWCEKWLILMAKIIRPGGSLMIVNLPKWSIHHATLLNKILNFRHWIVWDALSSPAGKIMPAHYSLLYYTKPGGKITFNYPADIIADNYCLRISCRSKRKNINNIKKVKVTDIWWDIHRIKHKRDRDKHPCQLPINLMKRIIEMVTNPGDIVYDPFCGTGTTALAAKMLNRNFITTEIDDIYVKIAKENLGRLQPTLLNNYILVRKPIKKKKLKVGVPKKRIEIKFIELCKIKNEVLTLEELNTIDKKLFGNIKKYYPDFKTLQKIARRRLEILFKKI